jgi:hypothetical protein
MNNEEPFEDAIVHQTLARKSIQEHLSMHANKTKHKEKFFDNPHPFHMLSHNIANRKVKSPNPNPYCMHKPPGNNKIFTCRTQETATEISQPSNMLNRSRKVHFK